MPAPFVFPGKGVYSAHPRPGLVTGCARLIPFPAMAASLSDDLEFRALKIMYSAGSHGVLQKHLFGRLSPARTEKKLNAVAMLQEGGYALRAISQRVTSRWGFVWTITNEGKAEYVRRLAKRDKPAPVLP